jgi:sugar phosphate isomerase/epimerase
MSPAMSDRRFGVSTHLFHEHRLNREHLVHVAGHGFEALEVFATRSHVDYRDETALARLAEWISDTRLELHSVHAPIVEAMRGGQWVGSFSIASGDEQRRKAAVAEIDAALGIARFIPFRYLVVHVGLPAAASGAPKDNRSEAAHRSVEEIVTMAARVGVRVALEVIPNPLSEAAELVRFIEDQLDGHDVGVCLDYGHAHLMGDLGEAIETLGGHLWTTHVHDNGGTRDDHLVPFAGSIDWDAAMMETQKVGYEGTLMLEVADTGDPLDVLRRATHARGRLERVLDGAGRL